jgi:hypothetical protein
MGRLYIKSAKYFYCIGGGSAPSPAISGKLGKKQVPLNMLSYYHVFLQLSTTFPFFRPLPPEIPE